MSDFQFEVESSALFAILQKDNTALAEAINPICEEVAKGQYQTWLDEADALFLTLGDNAGELVPEE